MESPQNPPEPTRTPQKFESLRTITPVSKYLAMALFIILPFIGGFVGYVNAPVTIPPVPETIIVKEKVVTKDDLDLKSYILQDGKDLVEKSKNLHEIDQNEVFRVGAEIKSYLSYWPDDAEVLEMDGILRDAFGFCWGIPEGKCLE